MTDTWNRSTLKHVRPSPLFLGLVGVFVLSGWLVWTGSGQQKFGVFVMVMTGWAISVCLHEFAHAYTALRFGDRSVIAKGYLTLDPVKYVNPLLTFVLPIVFVIIGWLPLVGGAVWIDRSRIRGKGRHSMVSASGPLANLVLAVVLGLFVNSSLVDNASGAFRAGMTFLALLQVIAVVLNLLPVPGLDGYGVIEPWLSHETRKAFAPFQQFGVLIVFAALMTPAVNNAFYDHLVFPLGDALHLDRYAAYIGQQLMRFWN